MEALINWKYVAGSLFYSALGLVIYALGFYAFDKVTPYHLWQEIVEKHNVALAILVGAMTIGIALIISSAIHG